MTNNTASLVLRTPVPEDAEKAFDLVTRCETADLGEALLEWEEHLADWEDIAPESRWVVATADQQIVGYAILFTYGPGDNTLFAYVHPDFTGLGIGTMLLQAVEQRVHEIAPPEGPVYFRVNNPGGKPAAEALFVGQGFHIKTHVFQMRIEMSAPPPAPVWSDDLRPRLLRSPDEDKIAWQVIEDAFEQPGRVRRPFEAWHSRVFDSEAFDPTLFWVVENPAGEIVAAIHCQNLEHDTNIAQVAVRDDYRQRGIGLNLLYTVFGEVWRRGGRVVVLSVDGQNPTNAISVYRRAGMSVQHHYIKWEKVLREI